ncbi:UDP-glucuronate 4-epimerase [Arachis hypogaea]|nr:UDP-glucuronate 4-epimerase [Arachis hypogaea]
MENNMLPSTPNKLKPKKYQPCNCNHYMIVLGYQHSPFDSPYSSPSSSSSSSFPRRQPPDIMGQLPLGEFVKSSRRNSDSGLTVLVTDAADFIGCRVSLILRRHDDGILDLDSFNRDLFSHMNTDLFSYMNNINN